MKITKFGQCFLLIEMQDKRILTDPGGYSTIQNDVTDINIILITHEHADHLHVESLKTVLRNNPNAKVFTNSGVGKILTESGIDFTLLEGTATTEHDGLAITAHDGPHAEIFEDYGLVQNTGYFIADTLFYPGDAYTNPGKPVPVLALPVAGPWCKSADAITYALEINPKKAFPVHDWLLNEDGIALVHRLVEAQLNAKDIEFIKLNNNETANF